MARTITLKFAGTCAVCGERLPRGAEAIWTGRGQVECTAHTSDSSGSQEDYPCSDMGYEDACLAAVGGC